MWATSVIKKTTKVNKHPIGENSPNLVTLKARHLQTHETTFLHRLSTQATRVCHGLKKPETGLSLRLGTKMYSHKIEKRSIGGIWKLLISSPHWETVRKVS
jgi:hypothetical protein